MHYIPTQNRVVEFWEKCQELYAAINLEYSNVGAVESASIFMLYKTLKGRRKGYETKRVTLHMHCIVYHIHRNSLKIKSSVLMGWKNLS